MKNEYKNILDVMTVDRALKVARKKKKKKEEPSMYRFITKF